MSKVATNTIFTIGRIFRNDATLFSTPAFTAAPCLQVFRHRSNKHWDPKFKKLRREKVFKLDLPNPNRDVNDMTPEEIRTEMKKRGVVKPRPWSERSIYISCTGGIFEPYVPPEGDGKFSAISKIGAKQRAEFLQKKGASMMAVRKMRNYDEDLNLKEFAEDARDIYIRAHESLAQKNTMALRQNVTERAYPEMIFNVRDKTIHWKFVQSLEPARVVHARCTDVISNDNTFAQLTVRFHTQQILAIYDRFGRLIHGSEILTKDVLEYVVFERHLSNEYGSWRLHDKIIPEWMPKKEPVLKTFVANKEPPVESKIEPVDSKVGPVVAEKETQVHAAA